jgi:hypothetical protein
LLRRRVERMCDAADRADRPCRRQPARAVESVLDGPGTLNVRVGDIVRVG